MRFRCQLWETARDLPTFVTSWALYSFSEAAKDVAKIEPVPYHQCTVRWPRLPFTAEEERHGCERSESVQEFCSYYLRRDLAKRHQRLLLVKLWLHKNQVATPFWRAERLFSLGSALFARAPFHPNNHFFFPRRGSLVIVGTEIYNDIYIYTYAKLDTISSTVSGRPRLVHAQKA